MPKFTNQRIPLICLLLTIPLGGCGKAPDPAALRFRPGATASMFSVKDDSVLVQLDGKEFDRVPIGTPVKIVDDAAQDEEPGVRQTRIYINEGKFKGRAAKVGRAFLRPAP